MQYGALLNAKDAAGLGDYQGRSWPGVHRHLAMVWLAMTWLQRLRRPLPPDDETPQPTAPLPDTEPSDGHADKANATPQPSNLHLQFAAEALVVRGAVLDGAYLWMLPRQAWESLQSVHRRFLDWCRAAVIQELLLLGRYPALPPLAPDPLVT